MSRTRLDVHPYTDRGRRQYQEDYFYTDPPRRDNLPWLGVVADGMGGHLGGDVASKAGVHALKVAFEAAIAARRRTDEALVNAVSQGHEAVLSAADSAGALGNMGSTVVAFAIDGPTLYWCSAGDSRLYLCRAEVLTQLTRDFTLAEDMRHGVSNGDWTEIDIANSPQRNALTSFMGTDNWRFHADSKPLQHGDVIIACSDGVYGSIESAGIVAACRAAGGTPTAQQIAENLQKRVLDVGKSNQDNSTAIVVRFFEMPAGAAKRPSIGLPRMPTLAIGGSAVAALAVAAAFVVPGLWRRLPPTTPPVEPLPAAVEQRASVSAPGLPDPLAVLKQFDELERKLEGGMNPDAMRDQVTGVERRWLIGKGAEHVAAKQVSDRATDLRDRAMLQGLRADLAKAMAMPPAEAIEHINTRVLSRKADIAKLGPERLQAAQTLLDDANARTEQWRKTLAQPEAPEGKKKESESAVTPKAALAQKTGKPAVASPTKAAAIGASSNLVEARQESAAENKTEAATAATVQASAPAKPASDVAPAGASPSP